MLLGDGREGSSRTPDPVDRTSRWWWIRAAALLIMVVITIFGAIRLIGVVQSALGAVLTVVLYVLFGAGIVFSMLQRGLDVADLAGAARSFLGAGWRKNGDAWLADRAPALATGSRPVAVVVPNEEGEHMATIHAGTADGDPFPAPRAGGEDGETTATILTGAADGGPEPEPAPSPRGEHVGPLPPPPATAENGVPSVPILAPASDGHPYWRWPI
jgi:hypothetical protein